MVLVMDSDGVYLLKLSKKKNGKHEIPRYSVLKILYNIYILYNKV